MTSWGVKAVLRAASQGHGHHQSALPNGHDMWAERRRSRQDGRARAASRLPGRRQSEVTESVTRCCLGGRRSLSGREHPAPASLHTPPHGGRRQPSHYTGQALLGPRAHSSQPPPQHTPPLGPKHLRMFPRIASGSGLSHGGGRCNAGR